MWKFDHKHIIAYRIQEKYERNNSSASGSSGPPAASLRRCLYLISILMPGSPMTLSHPYPHPSLSLPLPRLLSQELEQLATPTSSRSRKLSIFLIRYLISQSPCAIARIWYNSTRTLYCSMLWLLLGLLSLHL